VQPRLEDSGAIISKYRVNTNAIQRGAAAPYIGNRTRTGEPDRGVALLDVQEFDADGQPVAGASFHPSTPLLYLPLPVEVGDTWTSVAIDPKTQKVIRHEGRAVGRQAVDACGTRIDGWRVEATQTYAGGDSTTRTFNYVISNEFGGILIAEHIDEDGVTSSLKADFSIGQPTPSPLPSGADS
jgi:hypothetical protein